MTFAEVSIAAVITSVHTQYTLHSLNVSGSIHFTCVPVVVAAGPRQLGAEGEHQVEQSPGQNNDVGHTAVEEDQLSSVADTCRTDFSVRQIFFHFHTCSLQTQPKLTQVTSLEAILRFQAAPFEAIKGCVQVFFFTYRIVLPNICPQILMCKLTLFKY